MVSLRSSRTRAVRRSASPSSASPSSPGRRSARVAAPLWMAALASTAVLAAACGSSGSAPSASATTTPPTTTSETTTSETSSPSPTGTSPSATGTTSASPAKTTTAPPATPPATNANTATGGGTVNGLTLQQYAGQRVVYSYQGLTPPQSLFTLIRAGQVAGVIFFGGNISSEAQLTGVIKQLRDAQAASPVHLPLLLMTDQEGGLIRRLPGAPVLSAKQVGQSANPQAAATTSGAGAATNLTGVGMNLNLAPVLDVYYQAGNFTDAAQRSFSSNPQTVATLGSDFLVAQQKGGVAATAKHFPGLGSAVNGANTDLHPVTLNLTLNQLRTVDEVPYPVAIKNGVKLIMVSWAIYPALDSKNAAGMSSAVVQGELRGHVGWQGVTITDALEAGALQAYGTTGQRAIDAAQAGMDLLLCSSGDPGQGQAATNALVTAWNNGTLNHANFTAAVDRINALRAGLH